MHRKAFTSVTDLLRTSYKLFNSKVLLDSLHKYQTAKGHDMLVHFVPDSESVDKLRCLEEVVPYRHVHPPR